MPETRRTRGTTRGKTAPLDDLRPGALDEEVKKPEDEEKKYEDEVDHGVSLAEREKEKESEAGPSGLEAQAPAAVSLVPLEEKTTDSEKKRKRRENSHHFRPQKKTKRLFWLQEEVDALLHGVEIIGPGKWTKIKAQYAQIFKNRTSLDLKDKWRNIERRPDTNKRAKISRAKLLAATKAKSLENVELYTINCGCDEGLGAKKADTCVSSKSTIQDLYKWAYAKFFAAEGKVITASDIGQMEIVAQCGKVIPKSRRTLKSSNLIKDGSRLIARKKEIVKAAIKDVAAEIKAANEENAIPTGPPPAVALNDGAV